MALHRMTDVRDESGNTVTRAVEMTPEEEAAFLADQARMMAKIAARPKPRDPLAEIDALKAQIEALKGVR